MKKPHCSKCGRALTDPFSIAVGMEGKVGPPIVMPGVSKKVSKVSEVSEVRDDDGQPES